ncbi:unnamed protein product [Haemonchus placei]|uniref:Zinc transporter ZIP13 n=1 Tax=Haemonchus placei TaxID=6290 RepID=A0A0N4X542_HAEPC|nr:unnamed protein product [Haemonchus placei]
MDHHLVCPRRAERIADLAKTLMAVGTSLSSALIDTMDWRLIDPEGEMGHKGRRWIDPEVHNHPAAGPDPAGLLVRNLDADKTFEDNAGRPEALIDPDGREYIAPLKRKTQIIEEELRQEAEEISRLLNPTHHNVTPLVCFMTLIGCILVVLCGVLPALLLPENSSQYLSTYEGKRNLNMLLAFAVGSLLGDVFLHILPATWDNSDGSFGRMGLCTMSGLLACLFIEKLCSTTEKSQRKICAIMNLAANMVDNFTHGLAVGASFLISPKVKSLPQLVYVFDSYFGRLLP